MESLSAGSGRFRAFLAFRACFGAFSWRYLRGRRVHVLLQTHAALLFSPVCESPCDHPGTGPAEHESTVL